MDKIKEQFSAELEKLREELSDPKAIADLPRFQKLSRRHHFLENTLFKINRLEDIEKNLAENKKILSGGDVDLISLAEEESMQLSIEKENLREEIQTIIHGTDKNADRDVIMEIRAGAGGDEASLFAAELFGMYSKFAEKSGFKIELLNSSRNEIGGFKEVSFEISGDEAWKKFKFEGGVHRVQRIPETEKSGRIHTSTITIAVMPVAEEKDEIEINPSEIRVDVFRSSGPGGQSVNTTDSAVRITHLPTGVVVSCQDEKSQLKNKEKAMKILKSRLLAAKEEEERKKESDIRKSMIGTGDRSEKIRTYNFPQDRVTDHRIKKSWHGIDRIMEGEINDIIDSLNSAEDERINTDPPAGE